MIIERMVLEENSSGGGSGAELKSIIQHRKQKKTIKHVSQEKHVAFPAT